MKHFMLSALALLASHTASAAPRGDCMITSGKDLSGQALSFSHNADPHQVSSKLPFVPASFYIAKGYSLKVFERPYFGGAGLMIGRPLEIEYAGPTYDLHPTDGGYYINAQQLVTNFPNVTRLVFQPNVTSLACVASGTPYDSSKSLALDDASYYNDVTFYLATNPGRADSYQAHLTSIGDKKTLKMDMLLGYAPERAVSITVDLDTLDLQITRQSGVETFVYNRGNSDDLRYFGALSIVRDTLRLITYNNRAWRGEGAVSPVPNLELEPILEMLDRSASGLL